MDILDKKYYKISEVADIVGVPASTLRFWESRFPMLRPRRNGHNRRFYTPADVEKLRMINYLVKEKGLKLEAAEEQLRNNGNGVSRRFEVVDRLQAIRAELVNLLDALDARH